MDDVMTNVMIVTGGGRGIGAATARLGAARGSAVCVNYRADRAAAEAVAADIVEGGGRAIAVAGDVAREDDVARLFDETVAALGVPTALVNNAGITGPLSSLAEAETATLRRVIETNVIGVMLCAREAVRRMAGEKGGAGGAIVNVSSGAATLGSPGEYVWYAASKGAVDSLTKGLAIEVAESGIRVNGVAPGLTETDIHAGAGAPARLARIAATVPLRRAAQPEEVAEAILWLLSDAASYVTGAVLRVSGGR